jgi:hypothetical protein
LRSKILDFYPKKGIYSVLKYSKIDALHHVVATPLSGHPAPVFFLLQAKCNVIARNLSVSEGDIILKHSG